MLMGMFGMGLIEKNIHHNSQKTSRGVGILVRQAIHEDFDVKVVDKSYEGILGVQFVIRVTDTDFIVLSCYLPLITQQEDVMRNPFLPTF